MQLRTSGPGSDEQLAWARTLAQVSRQDGAYVEFLRGILSGSVVVDGLTVDADLRWSLWQALAANGAATLSELDAELAADRTASGREGHALAAAARPDADVKASAWEAVVNDTRLSNEILSATIAGFSLAPSGLLDGFTEQYFDCLEGVWQSRSIEIASRIVRGLFPAAQDLQAGVAPADACGAPTYRRLAKRPHGGSAGAPAHHH